MFAQRQFRFPRYPRFQRFNRFFQPRDFGMAQPQQQQLPQPVQVQQTPMLQPPPQPRRRRVVRKAAAANGAKVAVVQKLAKTAQDDVLEDLKCTITSVFDQPYFIACAFISIAIVYSHAGDLDTGPLAPFFPATSTNPFVKWVRENVQKFFGLIILLPTIFAVQREYLLQMLLFIFIWVFVVPEAGMLEYILQAFLIIMFMNVKQQYTRVALVVAGLLAYFAGFIFPNLKMPADATPKPPAART